MQETPDSTRIDHILVEHDRPHEDVLDGVYRKYERSHPFLPVTHFIDHSTMGAEALVALGFGHKVTDWISRHRVRAYEAPSTGISIASSWQEAIGRKECHGDWLRYFESELRTTPFGEVLAIWSERFVHDPGAFLFHGLIRTAHAARALEQRDTPVRRMELAHGLALWAIGIKSASASDVSTRDSGADAIAEIMQCALAGASVFIRKSTILNLHLVTGAMAYMMMAHHFDARVASRAAAAFRRTHAKAIEEFASRKNEPVSEPIPPLDNAHLEGLAKDSNAHPIKLTEAALRAWQATGDDLFLIAAGRVQNYGLRRALMG